MSRRHFTDAELFDLMDHLPDVTEHVHRSRQMTRSSMQHRREVEAKRARGMKLLNEAKYKAEQFDREDRVKQELLALKMDVIRAMRSGRL